MPSTAWIGLALAGLAVIVSAVAPGERLLGRSVGIVYLHGAWVWTSLAAFAASAVAGLLGLARRSQVGHQWSIALGRTGAFFWITYLPLSLWAMRATWGGLYLLEPRWRLGVDFALVALMVQTAIVLVGEPAWGSIINVAFLAALSISLATAPAVLHPPSPVFHSDSLAVRVVFLTILGLCLGAGACMARLLLPRRG